MKRSGALCGGGGRARCAGGARGPTQEPRPAGEKRRARRGEGRAARLHDGLGHVERREREADGGGARGARGGEAKVVTHAELDLALHGRRADRAEDGLLAPRRARRREGERRHALRDTGERRARAAAEAGGGVLGGARDAH